MLGLIKESKYLELEAKFDNLLQKNNELKKAKEIKYLELEVKFNNLLQENNELQDSRDSKTAELDELKKAKEIVLPVQVREMEELIDAQKIDIEVTKMALRDMDLEIEHFDEIGTVSDNAHKFDGLGSDELREMIDDNKCRQKLLIKEKKAWKQYGDLTWNNNLRAGQAMQTRAVKFMLMAFNSEVDNIIGNAKYSNFTSMHRKIESWFSNINKCSKDNHIRLELDYLILRLEELKIVFKYHLQVEFEKEEQRYIRESIREEKRVQKEIEDFVKERDKEEKAYSDALRSAEEKKNSEGGESIPGLNEEIDRLKRLLEIACSEKQRALSMAQITRSGHVYIISNKGSFGENIYKIGMTRRLDPMDRVKELGDASVPFFFDVHGIIQSEDAPALEKRLHKRFEKYRVNKINLRREFFRVSIEEIEEAICEIYGDIKLQKEVLKNQWDETCEIEELMEAKV